jgi:hypothetical protein
MFWAIQWWIFQPETNLRFLVDVERVKLTAEQLLGYDTTSRVYSGIMEDWQNRAFEMGYPISHWVVEVNAAQRFLLAHDFVRKWQALHGVMVVPHTTSRNKLDENLGVEALLPQLWRTGQVAGKLEDVGVCGGNVVVDARQEERDGLGDGSLVRGVAYAESWSGENASKNVAAVLDLVCYLGCTRI